MNKLLENIQINDKFITKSGKIARYEKLFDDGMYQFFILGLPYERFVLVNNLGESVFSHEYDLIEKCE